MTRQQHPWKGGEELWFSDAPSMGLHTDTDCEAGEESNEPVGSEGEASGRQTLGKRPRPAHVSTDAGTPRSGSPSWRNQ